MMRSLVVLLIKCLMLFALVQWQGLEVLSAQQWQAQWSKDGALDAATWRYQSSHFVQRGGGLQLQAPEGSRSSFIATTTITLGQEIEWSGLLTMQAAPSSSNYTYFLLAPTAENTAEGWYEYLTLCFGGEAVRNVMLARLRFRREAEGIAPLSSAPAEVYVSGEPFVGELSLGLRFRVRYRKGEGISLAIGRETLRLVNDKASDINFLSGKAGLGILCHYPPSARQEVRIEELMVRSGWEAETVPPSADDRGDEPPKGTELKYPLLSEVMANPQLGSPEYIELYNPNADALSLKGLTLAIGLSLTDLRKISLEKAGHIEAESYLVLTKDPSGLLNAYPRAEASRVVKFALPQLRNDGFVLGLMHGASLVDSLTYSPQRFPKKLRSRRGVSLERVLSGGSGQGVASSWRPALESAGYATPTHEASAGGASSTEAQSLQGILGRLGEESVQTLRCFLYSLEGYTLLRQSGAEARQWLNDFASSPDAVLEGLPLVRPQILILVVHVEDEKFSLKFLY